MHPRHLREDCQRCGAYLDNDEACRLCLAWMLEQEQSRNAAQVDILIQHKARRSEALATLQAIPRPLRVDPPIGLDELDEEPIVLLAPPPPVPLVPPLVARPRGFGGVGSPPAVVACAVAALLATAWLFSGPLLLRILHAF